MSSENKNKNSESEESDVDNFCPALPPHLLKQKINETKIIGPTLPPGMTGKTLAELAKEYSDCDDNEELIGPMPIRSDADFIKTELEREALLKRHQLSNKQTDKSVVRESWMTELPPEKSKLSIFGLGARTFASKAPIEKGDTSVWTDNPADKKIKELNFEIESNEKKQSRSISPEHNDEKITNLIESYNSKKRGVSLIDIHSKKMKKEEPEVQERRPFSREEDMHVNKFDAAQKASMFKKAQQLGNRFSKGNKRYL